MVNPNNDLPPLFQPNDSNHDWKSNARILKGYYRRNFQIQGYKTAADILVDHVISKGREQDTLVYPIVFLYRHYLELLIKNIIENGVKYLNKGENPPNIHLLAELWEKAKNIINEIFEEEEGSQELEIDHYIKEFVEVDKYSQAFRYHKDTKGNELLEQTELINIRHFSECINKTGLYLENISDAIYDYLDRQNDSD